MRVPRPCPTLPLLTLRCSAADPLLGLLTGLFAYRLWETDAKNAHLRPEGRSLYALLGRFARGEAPPRELYTGPAARV